MVDGVAQGVTVLAGRYQVGDLIGRGGMADVYAGTDERLGRRVAIKLLKASLAADPAFRSRFRREAQDAAKMAHASIVRIFDAGEETVRDAITGRETQVPFIVMEYVDGKLLSDLIAGGPMDPHQAVGIIEQVLVALEYSHRAGLVHRDVKPGNVMITSTGQVKVVDFGIARAVSESSPTLAETSTVVGTAQYFSPEQARGEAIDARTDLYSTGIVLFEMLTGRAPFVGENPVAVAYQHVNQQAVRPSVINPRVSPALDAVVLRAIAKDRFERFQTAAEFRAQLTAADQGTTVIKRPVPAADFHQTLFGVDPARTAGAEATMRQLTVDDRTRTGSRASQSRPPVAWIWGGIAVVAVVVIAVLYWALTFSTTSFVPNNSIAVPDVVGESFEDASAQLDDHGLQVRQVSEPSATVDAGFVVSTTPAAKVTVESGEVVEVHVSTGKLQVTVPSIINLSLEDATAKLEAAGFQVSDDVTTTHSPNIKANVVRGSTPEGGSQAEDGATVTLIVSDGEIDIEDVTGRPITEAAALLSGAQYQLDVDQVPDYTCSGTTVTKQSLTGVQKQHAKITLTWCAGAPAPSAPPAPAG
ncbi:Stk1 family PASTA domain-containing Ser/Thr kinase [Galbitalea sp. SE-J8]|uniref:Stk1 family PASTA domain-containing Ser/Thr kinase n=1 Tax=Galbitalea sp. SE-J8 TaxID=3054952 RepID=UPI00259D28BE|nr:Stk1 family PASTA domain-containing Ser/Thr kinase [Galbitalea sp. SE-J8]MDM4763278.1 Stk1 family PASTA domain-containing Ser/Thr kinase [Galbitalea sp. SE-J8]